MIVHDGSLLIKDEIKLKARAKMRDINSETESKIEMMNKETELGLAKIKEDILNDAKKRADIEVRKIQSQANVEINGIVRDARGEIINETIDEAMEELNALKPMKLKKELISLLRRGIGECGGDKLAIIANKANATVLDKKTIEKIKKEAGRKINIEIKTQKMCGGFIVYDESNNMFLDYSFDTMFKSMEDEIRTGVSKILFGEALKTEKVLR
ncbi:MAG: V-type ATP synthase subunit E family protein [archaeon]